MSNGVDLTDLMSGARGDVTAAELAALVEKCHQHEALESTVAEALSKVREVIGSLVQTERPYLAEVLREVDVMLSPVV